MHFLAGFTSSLPAERFGWAHWVICNVLVALLQWFLPF